MSAARPAVATVRVLLGHHRRRHRTALVLLGAGMALFEFAITRLAPGPDEAGALQGLFTLIPEPVQQMLGEQLQAALSPRGFLAFGWAHPFPMIMLAIWTLRVTSAALAREIGTGTMDLLAARPVSRASQVGAALVALLGGLAALAAAGWSGTAIGLATRTLAGAAARDYLVIATAAWLLFAAFGALALAASASLREGGAAIAIMAGLLVVSFALDYLARAWRAIEGLRSLSLFRYYDPLRMLQEGTRSVDVAVLAGVLAGGVVAAFVIFSRRDL